LNSNRRKVIIRVDGNSDIGLGHIYRGIALAEMLNNDFDICFIVKQDSTINPIIKAGFNSKLLPQITYLDEPEWLKQNVDNNAIIICDGYEFKTEYQKKIKEQSFKLVYVDDLVEYYMYADLVINHAPGIKKEYYKSEKYTRFALGPDYAILRPALIIGFMVESCYKIDTALVSFGGADINDFTYKFVEQLIKLSEIKRINVVLGAANKNSIRLNIVKTQSKLVVYQNVNEQQMFKIMHTSQIAIVPSSTTLYETCAVKMFVASGFYVDNQKNIYNGALSDKVFFPLGNLNNYDFSKIHSFIYNVILKKFDYMLLNQVSFIDGFIKDRFLSILTKL